MRKPERRRVVFTLAAGLFFSCLGSWGFALEKNGHVDFFGQMPIILLLTPAAAILISLIWRLLEKADRAEKPEGGWLARHTWVIPVILLACWLPAFLAD